MTVRLHNDTPTWKFDNLLEQHGDLAFKTNSEKSDLECLNLEPLKKIALFVNRKGTVLFFSFCQISIELLVL